MARRGRSDRSRQSPPGSVSGGDVSGRIEHWRPVGIGSRVDHRCPWGTGLSELYPALGFSVYFGAWRWGQGKAGMRRHVSHMSSIPDAVMCPETRDLEAETQVRGYNHHVERRRSR